jgi:two-component sensor histidine kinase
VDSTVTREFGDDTIAFLMAAAAVISSTLQRPTASADAQSTAATIGQVEEREVLLREMQHRVKNNFQLILASIAIQKRRFESAEVHRVLEHVANRVNAISLAHDQLSPGQDLRAVNVANYLRALCASLQAQMENATIEINADEVELAMERAVPLGLILNEAVMNSVKHAFGTGKGNINVSLQSGVGYGEARLTLADDGHGVRNPRPGGSGQKLIQALSRQIGGTAELLSSDKGTTVTVVFPVIA